jgi:hypothetical protein
MDTLKTHELVLRAGFCHEGFAASPDSQVFKLAVRVDLSPHQTLPETLPQKLAFELGGVFSLYKDTSLSMSARTGESSPRVTTTVPSLNIPRFCQIRRFLSSPRHFIIIIIQ